MNYKAKRALENIALFTVAALVLCIIVLLLRADTRHFYGGDEVVIDAATGLERN